jgi:ABC-2 type transport system permease protein
MSMSRILDFFRETFAVTEADVRKLRHDPLELFTRMVQPVLWLLLFGQVLARARVVPTGTMNYLDFIAPGILAQSTLFISIFHGISLIWERDLGIVHRFLVSPAARTSLVLGRALSSGVRASSQALAIYLLAFFLGVQLRLDVPSIVAVLATVWLGSAIFSTFSLIVACIVKTRERFMGIGQLLTMPLFFASNAIYPLSLMPPWLRIISSFNPLSYQVDALRAFMIVGGKTTFGLGTDFAVQAIILAVVIAIATKIYPTIIR